MKKVVAELEEFRARTPGAMVVIGGAAEVVARFLEQLPKQIVDRVAGTFPVDLKGEDASGTRKRPSLPASISSSRRPEPAARACSASAGRCAISRRVGSAS
jgi:hypothetical protein